jgi:hypothetical protein
MSDKDPRALVEALKNGATTQDAMMAAGYSEKTAKHGGKKALSRKMLEAIHEQGLELARIGEKLNPAHVEKSIAGQLYANMITGESKGNEAAKLLGSMVKFGAFKSDANTNVIILQNDQRPDQVAPDSILTQSGPTILPAHDVE